MTLYEFLEETIRADERANIVEEVNMHLREAEYEYDSNMGIGDNIGSALLKEYANGYKKGEQDGKADERAKVLEKVLNSEKFFGNYIDARDFTEWLNTHK